MAATATATAKANKIFRYNLCDDIMTIITQFAKVHQYDDRHSYKDAWTDLVNENRDVIDREVSRLEQLGYKGDACDKMFKAGRYYFRDKKNIANEIVQEKSTENAHAITEKKTRAYIVMQREVIQAMDKHLISIIKNVDFKPEKAYTEFCQQHIELLRREISRLISEDIPGNKITEKMKKTYKNRYYILVNTA